MLKQYLSDQNMSIYKLAKESGCPYSTVNDLVNGKVEVDSIKVGLLKKLAGTMKLSLDQLYELCKNDLCYELLDDKIRSHISVKRKNYYVQFEYEGKQVELFLQPVNKMTTYYIDEIAAWRIEKYIKALREERLWNTLLCEKTNH